MNLASNRAIEWTELGSIVPDKVIRHGIRRLLRQRLSEISAHDCEAAAEIESAFVQLMNESEIAPLPHLANEQHYEVPAEFFAHVLGGHRKYSACYWPKGVNRLDEAEAQALRITCERAGLADDMDILELGCGWGSLTLWMAEQYPNSRITGVSNSNGQREYILAAAAERGLSNVSILTRDMNDFRTERRFDRIVSLEMFEHMRNYQQLFAGINDWLRDDGQFFMHIFCHRSTPYEFVDRGPGDWMSRHFFSGGIMPSDSLPLHFQKHLRLVNRWRWDGRHYEKTANAWLENMDAGREQIMPILAATYGEAEATRWWMRWRIFFMACAELFGYRDGQEWWVGHYLFRRQSNAF
ncbi:MAG: cyclopropane-fatty-acyl-phospholipid synthase family protein [Gammaproteobacteria bacterium]